MTIFYDIMETLNEILLLIGDGIQAIFEFIGVMLCGLFIWFCIKIFFSCLFGPSEIDLKGDITIDYKIWDDLDQ